MKKKRKKEKREKKTWKNPDFEIHSLLDKECYITGVACDVCCDVCAPCDPAGS
ncbi:hypothetical protein ACFL1D_05455 [Candidatus Omnitrophota bacterium]